MIFIQISNQDTYLIGRASQGAGLQWVSFTLGHHI